MAHMQVFSEHFCAYIVKKNNGTTVVPLDIVGADLMGNISHDIALAELAKFCDGKPVSFDTEEGWFARLSAPGYLDCTPWDGPHETEEEARASVREVYDCDDNGDDLPEG